MPVPIMTRSKYEEFVALIKQAEWTSLKFGGDEGQKVQIWYNFETYEFEFSTLAPKSPFIPKHYNDDFIELYRVAPHTLKSLYSKSKKWKAINWKADNYTDSTEYGELMEYHINNSRSKFDIKGKIREAFEQYFINGEGLDEIGDGWTDANPDEDVDYDEELVNWEGKSREERNNEIWGKAWGDDDY